MKSKLRLLSSLILMMIIGTAAFKAENHGIKIGDTELEYFQAPGEKAQGKTVLILPGGGYSHHAMDHEGYDWVPFFNDNGVNVAILKYKLPYGNHEIPLNDVKASMQNLKSRSEELNINPNDIGIMGFSAGGHLASTYATHSESEFAPAFQILFYPVVSLQAGKTHKGSRENFLGENQSAERVWLYSNETQVNPNTPPAILFHSDDDGLVVPANSIDYYIALNKAGVPASLHIYPTGGHGWGFRESFPFHEAVVDELAIWLGNLPTRK